MKRIYDTHAHLNEPPLLDEEKEIYDECKKRNVFVNVIGVDVASSTDGVKLAKKYKDIYRTTVSIHPNEASKMTHEQTDEALASLEQLIIDNKDLVIAVGETGLDRYYDKTDECLERQIYSLNKHVDLAEKYNLPLVLHIRDAHSEMLDYLSKRKINSNIVIHCFSGNSEIALKYLSYGCYISYSGVVTFKNAQDLAESVKVVDPTKILCETDAPFLAPVPFRGKKCMPWYTENTIDKISEILGKDMSEQIYKNSCKSFNIKWD